MWDLGEPLLIQSENHVCIRAGGYVVVQRLNSASSLKDKEAYLFRLTVQGESSRCRLLHSTAV